MKPIKTVATLILLAIAAPALAQDIPTPEQVVTENDKNGDKAVDKAEWAASPAPIPFPEEFDANKDGKVDVAEITTMFASFFGGDAPPPPAPAPAPAPAQ
jgi:hypothetical protein